MLLGDLQPAKCPAMALLFVGFEGVGQEPEAIATVGVVGEPSLLEQCQPEVGIFADRIARPAPGALERLLAHKAHGAMHDDGVGLVAQNHPDVEKA